MRTSMWIAVAIAAALASCGKQLNPEYCAQYPNDPDCQNAGITAIDAQPPCTTDNDCVMTPDRPACDTTAHQCVQCFDTHIQACTALGLNVCGPDDVCYGCLPPAMGCTAGQVCVTGGTCEDQSDILYVAPGGQGDCTAGSKCDLGIAIGKVNAGTGHAVQIDDGDYPGGPYTITGTGTIVLFPTNGASGLVTISAATGSVFTITTPGTVKLQYLTIRNAPADGITCTQGTVEPHVVVLSGNGGAGLKSTSCAVTLDASKIHDNKTIGLDLANTIMDIKNNFIYANGSSNSPIGGVSLHGMTQGTLKFDSIAYNHAKNGAKNIGGLSCKQMGTVDTTSDIIAGNDSTQITAECKTAPGYVNNSASGVFKATDDLHLDPGAPKPMIIDNPASNCSDTAHDIDGDKRPHPVYCDLGADEL